MTSRSAFFASCLLGLASGLLGCQRVHVGSNDGGLDASASDGGSAREQCGPVLCGAGEVCCNSSCGICTEPGGACIEIACTNECSSNADCAPTDYCAVPGCGEGMVTGTCIPRPEDCATIAAPACGCDGVTYPNGCEAGRAGVGVASDGACGPPPMCEAMDARGDGDCAAIVGIVWDGSRCTTIGGCGCVGADCGSTYATTLECEQARSGCHSCAPQEAVGEGPCDALLGIFWDGTACVSQTGCDCVGADCGDGWSFDVAECEAAHRHCFGPPPGCDDSSECGPGEWCQKPRGACGARGVCSSAPPPGWSCPDPGPPVCGCDGRTYGCDDMATSLTINVAHDGECMGACRASDVTADGACDLELGWYFDGAACRSLSGCSCVGFDCGSLSPDEMTCLAAHEGCDRPVGGDCGGFAGAVCRPDEWCDYPASMIGCGAADEIGTCQPRPTACTFEVTPVCGCDGLTHDNECFANMAGTDVATSGTCASP